MSKNLPCPGNITDKAFTRLVEMIYKPSCKVRYIGTNEISVYYEVVVDEKDSVSFNGTNPVKCVIVTLYSFGDDRKAALDYAEYYYSYYGSLTERYDLYRNSYDRSEPLCQELLIASDTFTRDELKGNPLDFLCKLQQIESKSDTCDEDSSINKDFKRKYFAIVVTKSEPGYLSYNSFLGRYSSHIQNIKQHINARIALVIIRLALEDNLIAYGGLDRSDFIYNFDNNGNISIRIQTFFRLRLLTNTKFPEVPASVFANLNGYKDGQNRARYQFEQLPLSKIDYFIYVDTFRYYVSVYKSIKKLESFYSESKAAGMYQTEGESYGKEDFKKFSEELESKKEKIEGFYENYVKNIDGNYDFSPTNKPDYLRKFKEDSKKSVKEIDEKIITNKAFKAAGAVAVKDIKLFEKQQQDLENIKKIIEKRLEIIQTAAPILSMYKEIIKHFFNLLWEDILLMSDYRIKYINGHSRLRVEGRGWTQGIDLKNFLMESDRNMVTSLFFKYYFEGTKTEKCEERIKNSGKINWEDFNNVRQAEKERMLSKGDSTHKTSDADDDDDDDEDYAADAARFAAAERKAEIETLGGFRSKTGRKYKKNTKRRKFKKNKSKRHKSKKR